MNLTQLENIFQYLNSIKTVPSSWTIDQVREFCDYTRMEWAKDVVRIHTKEKLNVDHLLLNNVLHISKKKMQEMAVERISLLDAYSLTFDQIYETCMANPFFFKNFNDKNFQYQINKFKICQNKVALKRLCGLQRNRSYSKSKCSRCQGTIGKCTCETVKELLVQIANYIKSIYKENNQQNVSNQRKQRNGSIFINESIIKIVFSNTHYLPKECPLFWDIDEVLVLVRMCKLDFLDPIIKLNQIDGFIICLLVNPPFHEENIFLKCLVLGSNFSKTHNGSVRYTLPQHLTSQLKYQYVQQVGYMLFYICNMLNQTIYNCMDSDPFSSENQAVARIDYFNLFQTKIFNLMTKKAERSQTSDQLSLFKVFNQEGSTRHESVAFDQSNRSRAATLLQQQNEESKLLLQNQNIIDHEQTRQSIRSYNRQSSQTYQEPKTIQHQQQQQILQESILMQQSKQMQESVLLQQPMQESVLLQQPMQESVLMQQPNLQQSVVFQNAMQQSIEFQEQMQGSVMMIQQEMQGSVMMDPQQMQGSVMMDQKQQMQGSTIMQQSTLIDQGSTILAQSQSLLQTPVKESNKMNEIQKSNSDKPVYSKQMSMRQRLALTQQKIREYSYKTLFDPFQLNISNQIRLKSEQNSKVLTIGITGASFGRSQENTHILQDLSKVSSKHARIVFLNNRFQIQDLGSKRGTYHIANKIELKKNQQFYIGDKFAFKVLSLDPVHGEVTVALDKDDEDLKIFNIKSNESFVIGRDLKNSDYQFLGYPTHNLLSLKHCQISVQDCENNKKKIFLEDLQSKNGTWLRLSDKKKKSEPYLLTRFSKFIFAFETQYEVVDILYIN